MVTVADGKWVINGEPTDIPVDGRDWVPTILLHEGMVYVSTNTEHTSTLEDLKKDIADGKVEENWIVINPNDTDTKPGEDNNDFATVTGSEDEGWQITFPGENGQTIHVPSYAQYTDLFETVNDLSKNVQALNTLMSGNNFITGFKEVTDQLGNIIGFDATVVGYQSTKNEDGTYNYTQTKGGTIEYRYNDVVTLIKKDNVYYWHILNGTSEDGTPSYIDIKVDGTDWVPAIVPYNNYVYISISPEATAQTLEKDLATNGGSDKWIKIYNPQANGYTTVTPIYEVPDDTSSMIVGYTITFANGVSIDAPTFITTPKISFKTTGIINYDTATKDEKNYVNVEFTITGSFIDKPVVLASCEGYWISTEVKLDTWAEGSRTITGSVGVKPTTAYVGDSTNGKLTLYVPYYGNTAIAQKALQASGAKEYDGETKSVGAEQTSFSIEIKAHQSLNTENAPFKLSFQPVKAGDPDPNWISSTTQGTITGQLNGEEVTYTQDLLVERNYTEQDRSCYMHVYSPDGRKIRKVKIEQPAFDFSTVTNLADVDKTGKEDPANCYIISSPGRYMIPLYEGSTGAWKKTSAKLYKNANNQPYIRTDNTANVLEFTEFDAKEDFLLFEVDEIADGNTVIAATDENGNIIWSWHLWFCNGQPGNETYKTGAVMLDQALGASAQGVSGLYYQWGRKEPYLESAYTGGGATDKDSWASSNHKKTTTDPCPPGYQVPTDAIWSGEDVEFNILYLQYSTRPNVMYPYSYYVDNAGEIITNLPKQFLREKTKTRKVIGVDSKILPATEYELDHEVYYTTQAGAIWSSVENQSLNYEHYSKTVIIYPGSRKREKVNTSTGWIPNYQWQDNWKDLTAKEIDDLNSGVLSSIMGYFVDGVNPPNDLFETKSTKYTKDHGLQVRCVRENSTVK